MGSEYVRSPSRQRAEELGGDSRLVKGPLKGYHHETYVLHLPGGSRIVKVREPRAGILWFDRRCFRSEEELLRALNGQISRIPDVLDVEGMGLQGFIAGRTVGESLLRNRGVPYAIFHQIVDLFWEMAQITPERLRVERRCEAADHAEDGDSAGFLEKLIDFSEQQVFDRNYDRFGRLFAELGVTGDSFTQLRKHVTGLRERPFCLLHADLHRKNFIVDAAGRLWTIDWELAMMGDPLYDLATHLHLMRYPDDQARRMARHWCRAVDCATPGSSSGWEDDLPLLLAFKRAQSAITDVIRVSQSLLLRDGSAFNWAALPGAALKLQRVLDRGAVPLGMRQVPGHSQIVEALARWYFGACVRSQP